MVLSCTIQQNITDVIGKDIVIGMLQSISMKDYPEWVFEDFGFTILDECHHLGSQGNAVVLTEYSDYRIHKRKGSKEQELGNQLEIKI